MKKILIGIIVIFGLFFGNLNIINAGNYVDNNGNIWDNASDRDISNEDINFANGNNGNNTPDSCTGENSICSTSYMINTSDYGLGGEAINQGGTAKETVDNGLKLIVNKLLIAFGVLSLFIMTVGGGYMIFAHGQDELLNKGKSIFTAGLTSLIIALSAGIIMKIVISLLY